jgi:DNA-binding MarR family transcriptional regulator
LHTQVTDVNAAHLDPVELAAWRGLLRAHAALVRELDAELRATHELSLHEYEVLLILSHAPEQRLRMTELAASVVLSQSGLTRLVDRLVRAGSVERTRCASDGRGLNAELTPAGTATLEQARPTHLAGVRRLFVDRFDEDELPLLAGFWERVLPGATAE